jgi:hypothetical protein
MHEEQPERIVAWREHGRRSAFGKLCVWAFVLFNAWAAYETLSALLTAERLASAQTSGWGQLGVRVGASYVFQSNFMTWLAVDVLLGLLVLATRPRREMIGVTATQLDAERRVAQQEAEFTRKSVRLLVAVASAVFLLVMGYNWLSDWRAASIATASLPNRTSGLLAQRSATVCAQHDDVVKIRANPVAKGERCIRVPAGQRVQYLQQSAVSGLLYVSVPGWGHGWGAPEPFGR